jgi:cysteine synthase
MARQFLSAILDTYRPDLVALAENLWALAFPLMKIFPAEHCIAQAVKRGDLGHSNFIVETSSGTMALGLAIVCRLLGLRLTIVSDVACDVALRRRMEDLGAQVELVSAPSPCGGYQRARLELVRQICANVRGSWWVNQYDNPSNAAAYIPLADDLIERLGRVDCLIGTVGSGGSMSGLASRLRQSFPRLYVIGVDTGGSVLFGQPDSPRNLRGLGNSLIPGNLNHTLFDEVHWVSAAEAYSATRVLHRETTLFRGGTSGACWLVARHWARRHPACKTVCVMPDDGQRYTDTIYCDSYLNANALQLAELPANPIEVEMPGSLTTNWSCFPWGRRTLDQIKAAASQAPR